MRTMLDASDRMILIPLRALDALVEVAKCARDALDSEAMFPSVADALSGAIAEVRTSAIPDLFT